MKEVLRELLQDWQAGEVAGLATVVRTQHSAPRPAGACMLRRADGSVVGSVSGGCVEGAVYETAGEVIASGRPTQERFGYSDNEALAVGLTCGGVIDLFVEPVSAQTFPALPEVVDDIDADRPVAVAVVIAHPDPTRLGRRMVVRPHQQLGSLGHPGLDHAVVQGAQGLLAAGRSTALGFGPQGQRQEQDVTVFVTSFAPAPRMLVFGAIDFAAATARQAKLLGYHVTVCDARPVFATRARFPEADDLVVQWPSRYLAGQIDAGHLDERTVIAVLTHDPKFDVPILMEAFRLPQACFIGVMGSRRTHEDRLRRLREAGAAEPDLARLHSPVGLDLGARTPEETAVSIAAQIIATQWGRGGAPLTATTGAIHSPA